MYCRRDEDKLHYEKNKEFIEKFLKDIEILCKKSGFSIYHEDAHGGFIISQFSQHAIDWLNDASYIYSEFDIDEALNINGFK